MPSNLPKGTVEAKAPYSLKVSLVAMPIAWESCHELEHVVVDPPVTGEAHRGLKPATMARLRQQTLGFARVEAVAGCTGAELIDREGPVLECGLQWRIHNPTAFQHRLDDLPPIDGHRDRLADPEIVERGAVCPHEDHEDRTVQDLGGVNFRALRPQPVAQLPPVRSGNRPGGSQPRSYLPVRNAVATRTLSSSMRSSIRSMYGSPVRK